MTSYYGNYQQAAVDVITRVGKKIVLGIPLGLGKPIGIVNAIYKQVEADPTLSLTIITALTLARPRITNLLEKRFGEPLLERILNDYEDPLYEIARVKQQLPKNITVIEFFLAPGKFLRNTYVQENYISSKYTSVVDDTIALGINVIAQQIARSKEGETYSLSSNTDLFRDLLDHRKLHNLPMENFAVIGEVNNNMPYMYNDALVPPSVFTHIIDPKQYRAIFALPRDEVSPQDHMIGLYASCLIKDGGCLQIGIGTLSTAVADALIMRHQNNDDYQSFINQLGLQQRYPTLIKNEGGVESFTEGLYVSTEMVSDEYIHLYRAGIVKKRAYDHIGLQTLLNSKIISEDVNSNTIDVLLAHRIIQSPLQTEDVTFLTRYGIFHEGITLENGNLHLPTGENIPADLHNSTARESINKKCLGAHLKTGKLIHGGFFLGSNELYKALREMSVEQAQQIDMTRISRTNSLLWSHELAVAQRQHARFINSAMIVTLSGALVSDGLANLQEVSGVGGQFDFVNMAHDLEHARSIIICRSTRFVKSEAQSNVLWTYPNMTIPRYLRDIVITEYGIADCRSKTDSEVIKELLNVTDSRFQEKLLKQAKYFGKIPKDYEIPNQYRKNYPEQIAVFINKLRAKNYCIPYPFGTEFTPEEITIKNALIRMKGYSRVQIAINLWRSFFIRNDNTLQPYMERMQFTKINNMQEWLYKALFKYALTVEKTQG